MTVKKSARLRQYRWVMVAAMTDALRSAARDDASADSPKCSPALSSTVSTPLPPLDRLHTNTVPLYTAQRHT